MQKLLAGYEDNDLLYLISILIKSKSDIKMSGDPVLIAEMTFIKLTKLEEMKSVEELLKKVDETPIEVNRQFQRTANKIQKKTQTLTTNVQPVATEVVKEDFMEKTKFESLDIKTYEKEFETISQKIRKEKPFIYNYLKNAKLDKIINNFIHYSVKTDLALKQLNGSKQDIIKIFQNHFNLNIKIDFKLVKPQKNVDKNVILNPSLKDIKEHAPEIARLIEVTDAIIS